MGGARTAEGGEKRAWLEGTIEIYKSSRAKTAISSTGEDDRARRPPWSPSQSPPMDLLIRFISASKSRAKTAISSTGEDDHARRPPWSPSQSPPMDLLIRFISASKSRVNGDRLRRRASTAKSLALRERWHAERDGEGNHGCRTVCTASQCLPTNRCINFISASPSRAKIAPRFAAAPQQPKASPFGRGGTQSVTERATTVAVCRIRLPGVRPQTFSSVLSPRGLSQAKIAPRFAAAPQQPKASPFGRGGTRSVTERATTVAVRFVRLRSASRQNDASILSSRASRG